MIIVIPRLDLHMRIVVHLLYLDPVCHHVKDGYYLVDDKCKEYYKCDNGFKIDYTCPDGFFFNQDKNHCEKEEPSGCKSRKTL